MGKTTKVAADREYDQTKTVLPSEVAQGVYMQHAPSLKALKLMHLMIATAGGRMAEPVRHTMRLSDIKKIDGMANHSRQTIAPLFAELRAATMITDDQKKKRMVIGGLLDVATVDYSDEVSGNTLITWSFGGMFIDMAQASNHWAILDRQAVFHLGSKYSVLLFQHIASLQNLKHVTSKRFTVADIRAVLGLLEGKHKLFSALKRWVIEPAIAEINSDLTRLHLTATYHKVGRTVAEVEISWEVEEDLTTVKAELDRPKVGRKARQDGTADTVAPSFPEAGGLSYAKPWEQIAKDTAPKLQGGYVPNLTKLAEAFRAWCASKSINLDARNIEKIFTTWCRSYSPR